MGARSPSRLEEAALPGVSEGVTLGTERGRQGRRLRVLFVVRSSDFLRFFQSSLQLLVEHGHTVRLLIARSGQGEAELDWIRGMALNPRFSYRVADHFRREPWCRWGTTARKGLEYLRSLEPAYGTATLFAYKRLSRAPAMIRKLTKMPGIRTRTGLRALRAVLSAFDRALPMPSRVAEYVDGVDPDIVVLCDYGQPGSLHSMYIRAAKERGIPAAICVGSWDNLTTRQRTPVVPHGLFVWNQAQVREAVELHGIPADRVAVTGAPSFDAWFAWKPRARTEFLARVGLDPEQPVVLWVGSVPDQRSERTEPEYVADWLSELRRSPDPLLRGAGVLLRPHPYRAPQWHAVDFSGFGNVSVWPPSEAGGMPIDLGQKADYFDSIFHSGAVVGINTSAMIEASIIGRPVLTILEPEFSSSQFGTLHFTYLLESSGGAVQVAQSRAEHFDQLAAALSGPDEEIARRAQEFVERFVRPNGFERPVTPIFVETLERLAGTKVRPERDPVWILAARVLILLLSGEVRLVKSVVSLPSVKGMKRVKKFCRRTVPRKARTGVKLARHAWIVVSVGLRVRLAGLRDHG